MIDYNVIATGSKGNAVKIGHFMIDCGVPFTKIKEHLYDVKVLLITHRHGDHVNARTLKKIKEMFPKIKVIANFEVAQYFKDEIDIVCNPDFVIETPLGEVTPFQCYHDVECTGYTFKVDGKDIIYATDTSSLDSAPQSKYDYLFLEANYDEVKAKAQTDWRKKYGYNPLESMLRHLSVQKCKSFYYMNRRDKTSQLIELHQSARFY